MRSLKIIFLFGELLIAMSLSAVSYPSKSYVGEREPFSKRSDISAMESGTNSSTPVFVNPTIMPISRSPRRSSGDPFGGGSIGDVPNPFDPGSVDPSDPFGGIDIGDVDNPYDPGEDPTPIGGCLVVLMLLLAGMYAYRKRSSHSCNSKQKI